MATVPTPQQLEDLNTALRELDDQRRAERADRIVWLSEHERLPSALIGRTETMHLLSEARSVFVDGYFAATLLLAMSVINHCLVEELQLLGEIKGDPGFTSVLAKAVRLGVVPEAWDSSLKRLADRRHPFVHFKEPKHPHALGARVRSQRASPASLLKADAELAIEYMYHVFRATLREAA